ncbi:hypothetical protein ACQR1I_27865 [Bradyrhizobium sp. HKCCYLS2038]|uniref:hypothetical protein n=1 Tax=unclassified Bradyrhizobium TaxID=2631580 RepID=UPI003EBE1CB3
MLINNPAGKFCLARRENSTAFAASLHAAGARIHSKKSTAIATLRTSCNSSTSGFFTRDAHDENAHIDAKNFPG